LKLELFLAKANQLSGNAADFYSKGCRFEFNMQPSNLNSPPAELYGPTNLYIQIVDRNSAGFMKVSRDDLPYWPL